MSHEPADKLWQIFEDKLEEIYVRLIDPSTFLVDQVELERAWLEYLVSFGVEVEVPLDEVDSRKGDAVSFQDPFYTKGTWLIVPRDFAEKALVLGSLP